MITFKQYIIEAYIANPIPVAFRNPGLINRLDSRVTRGKGEVKTIITWELINTGKLLATQAILYQSMNDTVYQNIDYPVIVEYKGIGYILDGHLTIAHDLINKSPSTVYWVK